MSKPRIATTSLCGCFGCHMSLLDIDERILTLAQLVEFDKSPINDHKDFTARCAVGLIEGGCANAENVHVLRRFREQCDVLVSPSTPTTAFRLGERVDDPLAMYKADLCTIPSNMAGNAAGSFPCGLSPDDGLPVGFQVMAPALADDRVYLVGAALEAELGRRWGGLLIDQLASREVSA